MKISVIRVPGTLHLFLALALATSVASQSSSKTASPFKAHTLANLWFNASVDCFKETALCEKKCDDGNVFACSELALKHHNSEQPKNEYRIVIAEQECKTGGALLCLYFGRSTYYPRDYDQKNMPVAARAFFQFACAQGDARGCDYVKAMKSGTMPPRDTEEPGLPHAPGPYCPANPADGSPASSPAPPRLWAEFEVDVPPRLIARKEARYPESMRKKGLEGKVLLAIVVDEYGKVIIENTIVDSTPEFNQAALAAVSEWKYQGGKHCGTRVKVMKIVSVIFTFQ